MATQDNQQTGERNDPAIDPDTPDNGMGQDKASQQDQGGSQSQAGQSQTEQSQPGQSQTDNGEQSQPPAPQETGKPSGENSFTPDFEPEQHESPDTTKEEKDTGTKDADIDTPGG